MRLSSVHSAALARRRPGLAAVEAALVVPVIVLLLLGLWEIGRMANVSQIMNHATREAGRQASTGYNSYDQIKTIVSNDLTQAGLSNLNGLTLQITNLTTGDTGPGTHGINIHDYDPTNAKQNDQLEVMISLPYENVRWGPRLLTSSVSRINTRTIWVCLKDQSFPTNVTVPDGF
ncbi:MAG: TadE/TadG family type IV pilus assembly protein [Gemmataceae bacterium]